ncbi:hypothetical protein PC128_g21770 [Phytophthora cactorum]|nr:hypothetical protein PC128_g21770 [Phytophthora cactorum]KAG4044966.1 hypothetical protein PC123_g19617 [Phytophthora cactorum]
MAKIGRKRTTGKGAKPKLYKRSAVSYQHTLELRNKKRQFYAWKAPFKSRLWHKWVEILVSQVRAAGVAEAFKMVPPSRANLATWIKDAWAELSAETIKSGFRKARIVDQDARVTPPIQDQDWGSLVAFVRTYEVFTDAIDAAKDIEETCDVYEVAIV